MLQKKCDWSFSFKKKKKKLLQKKDSLVAPKKYRQLKFLNSNSMNISVCETSS